MDKLEQLASAHDSVVELLQAIDVLVLVSIICAAAQRPIPTSVAQVCRRDPRIQIPGLVRSARKPVVDFVFTTVGPDGSLELWIIEVELSFDPSKLLQWALYEVAFQSELNARSAQLAVFTPDPELREKIRTKILPRIKTDPVLVEPDQIERITDYAEARRRPEETILGCLFHAQAPAPLEARVEVFRAGWIALQELAAEQARRYAVAVMSLVSKAVVEQGITELRQAGELDEERWELFSESERKGHSFARGHEEGLAKGLEEGRAEGLEAGRAEGRQMLRRAVLDILELRGFEITAAARERVSSCESTEQLERWYAAAKSADNRTLEQVLATVSE